MGRGQSGAVRDGEAVLQSANEAGGETVEKSAEIEKLDAVNCGAD